MRPIVLPVRRIREGRAGVGRWGLFPGSDLGELRGTHVRSARRRPPVETTRLTLGTHRQRAMRRLCQRCPRSDPRRTKKERVPDEPEPAMLLLRRPPTSSRERALNAESRFPAR